MVPRALPVPLTCTTLIGQQQRARLAQVWLPAATCCAQTRLHARRSVMTAWLAWTPHRSRRQPPCWRCCARRRRRRAWCGRRAALTALSMTRPELGEAACVRSRWMRALAVHTAPKDSRGQRLSGPVPQVPAAAAAVGAGGGGGGAIAAEALYELMGLQQAAFLLRACHVVQSLPSRAARRAAGRNVRRPHARRPWRLASVPARAGRWWRWGRARRTHARGACWRPRRCWRAACPVRWCAPGAMRAGAGPVCRARLLPCEPHWVDPGRGMPAYL